MPPSASLPQFDTNTIMPIDPALIDRSFINDRMDWEDGSFQALRASIAAEGQLSPILIRPHPTIAGRFQAAFGHRRLRAARDLGRTVRCIIRPLTDRELVIAQGQENSARTDLSFIERARFALALMESGENRPTIIRALCVDKATLSRLISVAQKIPFDVVDAIGPAPAAGRERWAGMVRAYGRHAATRPIDPLLESEAFQAAATDARFDMLFTHLRRAEMKSGGPAGVGLSEAAPAWGQAASGPRRWVARNGQTVATILATDRSFALTVNEKAAPGFGGYLLSRLEGLYEDHERMRAARPALRHALGR
jgi:ParB family chromosome partitioning protein